MRDPLQLPALAEALEDENFRFRSFLKHHTKLRSEQIDELVFGISDQVWKVTDCTACGNCCRALSPTLENKDVERLACHKNLSPSEFTSKYLKPTERGEESPWIMAQRPCPFLNGKCCSVYEHRPDACRGYPYLDKPDFTFRTLAMMGRLAECPAVFEVWEQLKIATGFRR